MFSDFQMVTVIDEFMYIVPNVCQSSYQYAFIIFCIFIGLIGTVWSMSGTVLKALDH